MKRILITLCVFAAVILPAHAAVQTFQVTIGAATTQVIATQTTCRWVVFQNNAAHSVRIGDANTTSSKGILLATGTPGGSFFIPPIPTAGAPVLTDLSTWYVNGTQNDVIDVVCDVAN